MTTRFDVPRGWLAGKTLLIGALVLALLLTFGMIEDLIRERAYLYEAARTGVAGSWGATATLGGPIVVAPPMLVAPFPPTRMPHARPVAIADDLDLLPEPLVLGANIEAAERLRRIVGDPVYTARLHVAGRFAPPALGASGNATVSFRAGGMRAPGFGPQPMTPYAALGLGALTAPQASSFELVLQYALLFGALGLCVVLATFVYLAGR